MGQDDSQAGWPFVSLVMSLRNGEEFLVQSLDAIAQQDYPRERYELIVVDGGSVDGSLAILNSYPWSVRHQVIHSDKFLTIPQAMNTGIRAAAGEIIVKIDVRGYPSRNYLREIAARLQADSDLAAVGGSIVQLGKTRSAEANAWARSSVFGVGVGPYTLGTAERYVETLQCAGYRRMALERVELFDEESGHGEDEDLNWRLLEHGYRILFLPAIHFFYYARSGLKALFQQYFWYGDGRSLVLRKHPQFFKFKNIVPSLFLLAVALGLFSAGFTRVGRLFLFAVLAAYGLVLLLAAGRIARLRGARYFFRLLSSFVTIHSAYGIGFIHGVVNYWIMKRPFRYRGMTESMASQKP